MNKIKEILEELLGLINYKRIKDKKIADVGLVYEYFFENGEHCLIIGKNKNHEFNLELNNFMKNYGIVDRKVMNEIIRFNDVYSLLKYLFHVIYSIDLKEIFENENLDYDFYDKEENIFFSKLIEKIRTNKILKGEYTRKEKKYEELVAKHNETSAEFFNEFINTEKNILKKEYNNFFENLPINVGMVDSNILDFSIIDYKINYYGNKRTINPFYSLDLKFQILTYLEEEKNYNIFDIKIPNFLVFPVVNGDYIQGEVLNNNLKLLYLLDKKTIYKMLLDESVYFENFEVEISKSCKIMQIDEMKSKALSELSDYLSGHFYIGSENIITYSEVVQLSKEFKKRSYGFFKKNLFAQFVLCLTGLKITDFNTVDSFYNIIEKIAEENLK